jgi:hypothetical protein
MSAASAAVARLSSQRQGLFSRFRETGHDEGSRYVREEVSYPKALELVSLADFFANCTPVEPWAPLSSFLGERDAYGYHEMFTQDGLDPDQFALGFLEGAISGRS